MAILKRNKYFNYKLTLDNSNEIKYYITKKDIIKDYPQLTERIIYKYICRNHKDYVPRERRRHATLKRKFWIEKCRILIIGEHDKVLKVPDKLLN